MGLTPAQQARHFRVEMSSYMMRHEERMGHARGRFPGLNSLYHVHEVDVHVVDPLHPELACMGLPRGGNFSTVLNFNLLLGSEVKHWSWSPKSETGHAARGTVAGFPRGSRPTEQTKVLHLQLSNYKRRCPKDALLDNGLWPGTEGPCARAIFQLLRASVMRAACSIYPCDD